MSATVIAGATVIDGTGREPYSGDVLIDGDTIRAVRKPATFDGLAGVRRIDAPGSVVTPGFIDTHAHADNSPLLGEDDTSKVLQGVTTDVNGNCGFSLAPVSSLHSAGFHTLMRRIFPEMDVSWSSFDEYRKRLDVSGYVTNFATLIGHNTIRIAAMGDGMRAPSKAEFAIMERLLDDALSNGVAGLSSGLIYPPGVFAEPDELVRLAARMPASSVYASHMRNESRNLLQSLRETVHVAQQAGIACHISHLKFADRHADSLMRDALEYLDRKRLEGLAVTQDMYPYAAASTMLTALLPPWMHDGGAAAVLQRLQTATVLDAVRAEIDDPGADFENYARAAGWENIVVASTASHRYEGESILAISRRLATDPIDALATVLLDEQLQATMIMHVMDEADVSAGLQNRFTMIGTDGLPVGTGGKPHPRGYGSFPRMLEHYVRKQHAVDLVEAVRRMTSLAAQTFRLDRRGTIAAGNFADLVIFRPDEIRDNATYDSPTMAPSGIDHVFVNGEQVVANAKWMQRRAGRFLASKH